MDLELFGRVLWRFRTLVGIGLLVAVVLTFFAAVRIGSGGIEYRSQQQWASYSRIFVTESGFPWGKVSGVAQDPSRFASLAILYANLADSDAVHKTAFGGPPQGGTVEAAPVLVAQNTNDALPLISIAGVSHSRSTAISLAQRETTGLIRVVEQLQTQNGIAPKNRVLLQVVAQPTTAKLLSGRSKTLPIVVFLTVLIAVCGLAFVLENLRPKVKTAEVVPDAFAPPRVIIPALEQDLLERRRAAASPPSDRP